MKRGWFVDYGPKSDRLGDRARQKASAPKKKSIVPSIAQTNVAEKFARVNFGRRSRKKARIKRVWMYAWLVSVVGAAAGIPGTGINLFSFGGTSAAASSDIVGTTTKVEGFRTEFPKRALPLPRETHLEQRDDWTEEEIIHTIYAAASEFGLSWDYLLGVAKCESTLNPFAYHPAGYHGLFQFDFTTWEAYGYGSIYNPKAQARTAARLLAAGHFSRWPVCSGH